MARQTAINPKTERRFTQCIFKLFRAAQDCFSNSRVWREKCLERNYKSFILLNVQCLLADISQ